MVLYGRVERETLQGRSQGVYQGRFGSLWPPPIPSKKRYKAKTTYSIYNIHIALKLHPELQ